MKIDQTFVLKTLRAYAAAGRFNTAQSASSTLLHWLEDYQGRLPTPAVRRQTAERLAQDTGQHFDAERFDAQDFVIELFIRTTLRMGGSVLNKAAPDGFARIELALARRDPMMMTIVDAITEVASEGRA